MTAIWMTPDFFTIRLILNNIFDNPGVALLTGFGAIIYGDKFLMRRFLADV
jgi:hypothetical protein